MIVGRHHRVTRNKGRRFATPILSSRAQGTGNKDRRIDAWQQRNYTRKDVAKRLSLLRVAQGRVIILACARCKNPLFLCYLSPPPFFAACMSFALSRPVVDLSDEPDEPRDPTLLNFGCYGMPREYLEACLRPGVWLHDDAIAAFAYVACRRDTARFVDSQRVKYWLAKGPGHVAPPGVRPSRLPEFLIVNDTDVHWYLLALNHDLRCIYAFGASRVPRALCRRLHSWLGRDWGVPRVVPTPISGDPGRDEALRTTECGVSVCRAIWDLCAGLVPRTPRVEDREWILATLLAGADLT